MEKFICKYCGKPVRGKFCNVTCQNKYRALLKRQKYEENPDLCINCGKPLSWKQHCEKGKFCSHNCSATYTNKTRGSHSESHKQNISNSLISRYEQYPRKRKTYTCIVCGNEYYYKKGFSTKKCCSKNCSLYLKQHRKEFLSYNTKQLLSKAGRKSVYIQGDKRRSKNEIDFYNLCKDYFSHVDSNELIFNGWDADVIIHDYKIAILWNGAWHYKEIHRKCSLKQIQNRDKIKTQEIIKYGYIPYVIKDMGKENHKFVLQEFDKLLDYIKSLNI